MPPRKKKNDEVARLAKLAAIVGMNVDDILEAVPQTEIGSAAVMRHSIEAESVLFYIHTRGRDFQEKLCQCCKMPFLHTYRAVEYCSDTCRAEVLSRYGIIWNFQRKSDDQRWNIKNKGYIPKIIGAGATEALVKSGNIYHDLPKDFDYPESKEETEMDEEEVSYLLNGDLPIYAIPEDSMGPVDEYEKAEERQEEFESWKNERRTR